jgi:hypothetical protein
MEHINIIDLSSEIDKGLNVGNQETLTSATRESRASVTEPLEPELAF